MLQNVVCQWVECGVLAREQAALICGFRVSPITAVAVSTPEVRICHMIWLTLVSGSSVNERRHRHIGGDPGL